MAAQPQSLGDQPGVEDGGDRRFAVPIRPTDWPGTAGRRGIEDGYRKNGFTRRYLSKGTDCSKLTDTQAEKVMDK